MVEERKLIAKGHNLLFVVVPDNLTEYPKSCSTQICIAKPRYDQSTYLGRVKHFIKVTSPRNLFVSGKGLENAKNLINDYNAGKLPASTDPAKLWRAKESKDMWSVVVFQDLAIRSPHIVSLSVPVSVGSYFFLRR